MNRMAVGALRRARSCLHIRGWPKRSFLLGGAPPYAVKLRSCHRDTCANRERAVTARGAAHPQHLGTGPYHDRSAWAEHARGALKAST
jgi:hypothetical protein